MKRSTHVTKCLTCLGTLKMLLALPPCDALGVLSMLLAHLGWMLSI